MAIPVRHTTGWVVGAQMVDATTGVSYAGTVRVYLSGDGGLATLGSVNGGVCTPAGNGFYVYHPSLEETDYNVIAFEFLGAGAVPKSIPIQTISAATFAALANVEAPLVDTVRSIITDALLEIGVLEAGESPTAESLALGLRRVRRMIDAWAADRLTLSLQKRTLFTWPGATSTVQVGRGQVVDMDRPVWLNAVAYVIPGSAPAIEVPIGILDEDSFAGLTLKELVSALPTLCFYQTNRDDQNGTLFVWPRIPQNIQLVLYTPQATAVPATLDSVLQGPPGYADAFLYQLALRLCTPLGVAVPALLPRMAAAAFENMKKPNVSPGTLSIDQALVPGLGAGFNVLTGTTTTNQ
jgi:hypothetical protein